MDSGTKRRSWGRIGGLTAWSRHGIDTMLAPAQRGFAARFERLVDPTQVLSSEERTRRAERARRAWMLQLAAKSADARRMKKVATAGRSAVATVEVVDGPDEPQQPA